MAPVPLAEVRRSGFVEGQHFGHAVVLGPDNTVQAAWGDPETVVFPRSCLKPVQATAMVRAGLDLPGPWLALAAASHSGEAFHRDGVRAVLDSAGLDPGLLRTPPEYPLDPVERDRRVADGQPPDPVTMNCSGKHAAMLVSCRVNGWDVDSYLTVDHPLQVAIRAEVEALASTRVRAVGVDGCGAPVLAVPLVGLARAFAACVSARAGEPARRVADAMRAHPEWVGGTRRDVTALMRGVPGLLAKDGAEAVYAAALPDGTSVAVKIIDGGDRARSVVMATLLARLGIDADVLREQAEVPVLGGGRPVGAIRGCL